MNSTSSAAIDPKSLLLLQAIERSDNESDRLRAIDTLSASKTNDAARILQETFERSVWRETKFALIRALGHTGAERAVLFLCRLAADKDDLAMASEAILALGCADHPVAGEFLASIIMSDSHPLTREALIAVANLNYFPCDELIASVITKAEHSTPTPVLQNAIIAAGLRHQIDLRADIESILFDEKRADKSALFNTAVITLGRVGNQDTIHKLQAIDTRFRAFAHQLKTAAIESIRLRLGYTVEDVISQILDAKDSDARRQAFQALGTYPTNAAREAFELLATNASADLRCLMRLYTRPRAQAGDAAIDKSDTDFLIAHSGGISSGIFAALARSIYRSAKETFLKRLIDGKHTKIFIEIAGSVYSSKTEAMIFEILENHGNSHEIRLLAINALVARPMMQIDAAEIIKRAGKKLCALIPTETDEAIQSRMIRALGQLGYSGADAITIYRDGLKDSASATSSIYAALAMTDSDEAVKVIDKRLRQIISKPDHAAETKRAVESLSKFPRLSDLGSLDALPPELIATCAVRF